MNLDVLFDPLFLVPFLNGLMLAVLLPIIGNYSRIRNEWLASLGVTQAAAAGLLLGAFVDGMATAGALLAATVAALAKWRFGGDSGNDGYAIMLLVGWSATLLLAANTARGEDLSRGLLEGQLYFTGPSDSLEIAVLLVIGLAVLYLISRELLVARLFPDRLPGRGGSVRRYELVFDVIAALSLALAASLVGVMAAFALIFIPAWIAFRFAGSWRASLIWSVSLGLLAYVGSFATAVLADQPYGPVLVASLVVVGCSRAFMSAR
jgi:zinc/manganese transport system permease protein